ncbi:MAG: 2'-carboxy-2,3-dihydroxybiphenyl 1,2-dioxygenase large subunit [Chloroflexi bacterium]|jgi:aromatic ring-opening dioxygenase catalytic subunit (LigB family)|nr:MAG: 2'-carboxy-2,3-dihydroxybiphenyl 1,2-dioxygenase large subunit [Chloroflexota bacterium]
MGSIVAAMATVHAPQLVTLPPEEDQAQLQAGIAAMRELGKVLDETNPDVLLLIGIDHLETYFLDAVPTFALVTGERTKAAFAHTRHEVPNHQPLAKALLEGLIDAGFDLTFSENALLGHAFSTPLEYVHEGRNIPVVPLMVNVYLPPLPTPKRCADLGRALAKVIEGRPERVAIVASGGMSHYPGTWKYYDPEYDFDRWAIREMENGALDDLMALSGSDLDEVGNTEMLTWMVMFGAIGPQQGELLSYQPTSHHGHAVMRFLPGRSTPPPARTEPKYGGFQFKGAGYEFYKYPPSNTYSMQKLLVDLRGSASLRERFFEDMDAVISEREGLEPEQIEAVKTLQVKPMVDLGAHPILTLTSILVIQAHQRRLAAAADA